MAILPSYTVHQWSQGIFEKEFMSEAQLSHIDLDSLRLWALSMKTFDMEFTKLGISNALGWLRRHNLIRLSRDGLSWEETSEDIQAKI
jgi:hypothetical protein